MDGMIKINDVPVIGTITIKGITYYVDINRDIYTETSGEYNRVTNEETLKMVLDYISPRPLDIIM